MNTYLNVRPNKYIKSLKEVNLFKKDNNSSQISHYNRYLSSSLPKENKTLKKYINERLNSITKIKNKFQNSLIRQNPSKSNSKYKQNLIYKKSTLSSNLCTNKKSINQNLKQKLMKDRIYNKKTILTIKKSPTSYENINENYKSANIKKDDNSKLINSISTSTGMNSTTNKFAECSNFRYYDSNNYNNSSIEKNKTIYDKYNNNKRFLLDESNYCKHKINNFNYETGSDDYINENIILLKCDNNYSSLSFGNSFSYSNSQRSKKYNEDRINKNHKNCTFYFNNNKNSLYVNKLKEENEQLKKELKESNNQISLLKSHINKLEEINNTNFKKSTKDMMIFPPNIWDKRHLKYETLDDNNFNYNKDNNIKECSMSLRINEKIKIKKDMLKKINNTFNEENFYKSRKKLINVKKNINLKMKVNKKPYEEYYSLRSLDKPCEKITECITSLRI